MKHNFNATIPTHIYKSYIRELEGRLIAQVRKSRDTNERLEILAKLDQVAELKNLPETLSVLENHDEEMEKERAKQEAKESRVN